MKYEIEKIVSKAGFLILLVGLLVFSVISPLLSVKNENTLNEKNQILVGKAAIEYDREQMKRIPTLNRQILRDVLHLFHQYSQDEAYGKVEPAYPGVLPLLIRAYSPPYTYDIKNLQSVMNGDDFCEKRIQLIQKTLNYSYAEKMFEDWEKEGILQKAQALKFPFPYGYYGGWERLAENVQAVTLGVICLAAVLASQVFTYEKETGMWEILQAFPKKTLRGLAGNKIKALFFILFLLYTLLVAGMFFFFQKIFQMSYGIPIQAQSAYFLSIYSYHFEKAFFMQYVMGMISIFATAVFCSVINTFCRKSVTSLILNSCIIAAPLLLQQLLFLPLPLRKIFSLCPVNGAFFSRALASQQLYSWAGVLLLQIPSICIANGALIALGIFFLHSKKVWAKR